MYETFYGLRERPFDLTSNPRFLFLTPGHREALSTLQYGLTARRGITLLVGEAGTGKTTLIRAAMAQMATAHTAVAYLNNPTLTRQEFFEFLARSFRLGNDAGSSKACLLDRLYALGLELRRAGGMTALIVDEAQSIPDELLEEIRLLSNLETNSDKLLPIVLAGQPELADRLNGLSLRQLKQRVALRCQIPPLDLRETAAYIAKRIRIAGGESTQIFTREAVRAVFERSGGIPRTISVLCDNALVTGFALERRPVDAEVVAEVAHEFDFAPAVGPGTEAFGRPGSDAFRPGRLLGENQTPPRIVEGVAWGARHPARGSGEAGPHAPGAVPPADRAARGEAGAAGAGSSLSPVAPAEPPRSPSEGAADAEREFFSMFAKRRRFLFFG